jgi:hypothetical protein
MFIMYLIAVALIALATGLTLGNEYESRMFGAISTGLVIFTLLSFYEQVIN